MPRPDWMTHLPDLGPLFGGGLWCGQYYPCLCQSRVREALATHMQRETGVRLDFDDMTAEMRDTLAEGLRVAEAAPERASFDARWLRIVRSELRISARRNAPAQQWSTPQRTPPQESQQKRDERRQRHLQEKERELNPRYRERVQAAITRGESATMLLSRAARRLPIEYFQTTFTVRTPDGRSFDVHHGALHPELDAWIASQNSTYRNWVLVTAWNPGDARPSEAENRAAQERLREVVLNRGWPFFEGVGALGEWSEDSLLVLVPRRRDGLALGTEFAQAAVLIGRLGGHAAVVPCPR